MHDLPAARLVFEIDGIQQEVALSPAYRIGRSDNNNLVLNDEMVSRQHAMLQLSDSGQFYITDLGSSNGTFVNGSRISVPTILSPGDMIEIGFHKFCFHQEITREPAPVLRKDTFQSTGKIFVQKLISVLVMDIRDFTGLAQRTDPQILAQITETFFRESGRVLQQRRAWGQKYIGDAVMAVWQHRDRDPEREDFLRILDAVCHLSRIAGLLQDQFQLREPVRVGAAINTGLASLGNVGSSVTSDYTALGDVVNKAFRLESATKTAGCDLLIGENTHDQFDGAIADALFKPCTVLLKGYAEPAKAYRGQISAVDEFFNVRAAAAQE